MVQPDLYLLGIGEKLREAREKNGLKLSEVSTLLRIREDHLAALESEEFERLPGKAYVIGFIRSYATQLGLDAAELISRFKAVAEPDEVEQSPYNIEDEKEPIAPILKWGAAIIIILGIYLIWLFTEAPTKPMEISQSTSKDVPEEAIDEPILQAPTQDPIQAATQDATQDRASSKVSDASPVLETVPDAETPVASALPVDVKELAEDALPVADVEPVLEGLVQIRAKRRTWMRIENGEGKVLFSSIVSQGGTFTLEAGTIYFMATRDAGALEYVVNEEGSQSVGRRGQIVTKRQIDRKAILEANLAARP